MIAISSAEDFHAAVAAATEKPLVACFSAPWCGGCKLVAPKVATLAEELEATVSFAKVGAEELETLCEEVEVDSFPHFRVYQAGKILGDYTSSKFDKVDAFIRGLVAPDTVEKTEETPEGEAAKETTEEEVTTAEGEGSKKRQEREGMEANDEPVAKKSKAEEEPKLDEKEVAKNAAAPETAEKVEEAATDETEKVAEETEKEAEEAAPADKLEASEAAANGATPADAVAA
ncbi:hypothetical protein PHYPSEUDO_006997 [Phytophthora pseudosyringae]|uniref:Thioredoxin domain-containing protein n=1 Tax=Phytophthora pseudosyringae TaxID=221518 RepID=A0A8T1VKH9_9STRA|nr:hypothetical protein PHYPSEUDO_006997 [Phytophthora pseudosyringae]